MPKWLHIYKPTDYQFVVCIKFSQYTKANETHNIAIYIDTRLKELLFSLFDMLLDSIKLKWSSTYI